MNQLILLFFQFIRFLPLKTSILLFPLLLAACDGDDEGEVLAIDDVCQVAVNEVVDAQKERFQNSIQSKVPGGGEYILREGNFSIQYQLGEFLLDGASQRVIDVNGAVLPEQLLAETVTEGFSFNSDMLESSTDTAFASYSGFAIGAEVQQATGKNVAFDSVLEINHLRLRRLSNTQEVIDANLSFASNSNQFVYGVIEGEITTTVTFDVGCGDLTTTRIEASYLDYVSYSNEATSGFVEGAENTYVFKSGGPVAIAYLVRSVDTDIPVPQNLRTAVNEGPRINLSWDAAPQIRKYRVFYSQDPNFNRDTDSTFSSDVDQPEFQLFQGVDINEEWYFSVAAISGGVVGELSQAVSVTVPCCAPEEALTLSAQPNNSRSILLSWSAPPNQSVTAYKIFRRENADNPWVQVATISNSVEAQAEMFRDRKYADTNIAVEQEYFYYIVWDNYLSPPSSPASAVVSAVGQLGTVVEPIAKIRPISKVKENSIVSLNGSESSHPAGSPLSYQWRASDKNMVSVEINNSNSSLASFIAPKLPEGESFIVLEFILTVSDGELSDVQTVSIIVEPDVPVPTEPVPEARLVAAKLSVEEGDTIELDASSSTDPEGKSLSYTWTQVNHLNHDFNLDQFDSSAIAFLAPFGIQDSITFHFLVEVSNGSTSDRAEIEITVNERGEESEGLLLGIETNDGSLEQGEQSYWSFTVSNTSDFDRENVKLTTFFPASAIEKIYYNNIHRSGKCEGGSYCDEEREPLIWDLGTVAAGESVTRYLMPKALATLDTSAPLTLEAVVNDGFNTSDSDSLEINLLSEKHLELQLTANKTALPLGDTVELNLVYGYSDEASLANNVVLDFYYPNTLEFVAGEGGEVSLGVAEDFEEGQTVYNKIQWKIGELNPGESGRKKLTLKAKSSEIIGSMAKLTSTLYVQGQEPEGTRANKLIRFAPPTALSLAVDYSHNPVVAGEPVELYFTLTNTTDTELKDIYLWYRIETDAFASFYYNTLVSAGGSCPSSTCQNNQWISWKIPSLEPGLSQQRSFSAPISESVVPGESLPILLYFSEDGKNYHPVRFDALQVAAQRHLNVELGSRDYNVADNQRRRYSLGYNYNKVSAQAEDVALELWLPPQVNYISATGGGEFDGEKVTWALGNLKPEANRGQQVVEVTLAPSVQSAALVAKAKISAAGGETSFASNSEALFADSPLTLSFNTGSDPLELGKQHPVTLHLGNTSSFPRSDVRLELRWAPEWSDMAKGIVSDAGVCGSNSYCDYPGELVVWTLDSLAKESVETFEFFPTVNASTADGKMRLRATVTDSTGATSSLSDTYTFTANRDLDMSIVPSESTAEPGKQLGLTLYIGNKTATKLDNVAIQLLLPSEVEFVTADAGAAVSSEGVQWQLAELAAGAVQTINLVVKVNGDIDLVARTLDFFASATHSATSNREGISVRAQGSVSIVDDSSFNLRVTAPTNAVAGEVTSVALEVTNTSEFRRDNVNLYLRYPQAFAEQYIDSAPQAQCVGRGNNSYCYVGEWVKWSIATMDAGETLKFNLNASINSALAAGSLISLYADVEDSTASARSIVSFAVGASLETE